jgi:nucleotide-binding universal stress UspA family protein
MEKILVTTDFSANSNAGIRFAIQLASQAGYDLTFYHAIEIMKPTSWNDSKYKKFAAAKISENKEKLKNHVAAIFSEHRMVMGNYKYVAEIGTEVDDMVIRHAKKIKAACICMSTRGAGRVKKLFGTNASTLVTTSPMPVIVVPKTYKVKPISRIFYAADFSSLSRELKLVQQFAAPLKVPVSVYHYDYLLHVPENRKKLEKKARAHIAPNLSFHFKRQEIEHSLSHHLKKDLKKEQASLVVLFTKQNRGWFDRLFAKMETANMAFNTTVPMLTFRKK